jgi:hypothetical protein
MPGTNSASLLHARNDIKRHRRGNGFHNVEWLMPHEMRFSVCHDLVRKADSRHDRAIMHTQRCHPPTLRYIVPTIAVFVSEHADFYKPGLVHGVVSRAQSAECYPLDV